MLRLMEKTDTIIIWLVKAKALDVMSDFECVVHHRILLFWPYRESGRKIVSAELVCICKAHAVRRVFKVALTKSRYFNHMKTKIFLVRSIKLGCDLVKLI